ncbi:hypothetical protein F4776DRAFT_612085 [Hypoxylon sp. NC0597]|nr:hypothetical protein F4776DRAFT_612085 [Hypoxylon sp. NC0597]
MPSDCNPFLTLVLEADEDQAQASNRTQRAAQTLPTQSLGSNHMVARSTSTPDPPPFELGLLRDSPTKFQEYSESNGGINLTPVPPSEFSPQYEPSSHIVFVKILACLLRAEKDTIKAALTLLALSNSMGHENINPIEAAKRANVDASVQKYMADINRAVGGSPPSNASREDWNSYLDAFMNEKRRRDKEDEENSWSELAKATRYVERMKQPVHPMSSGSEEDDLLKALESTMPGWQEDQSERRQTTKHSPRERPKKAEEDNEQKTILGSANLPGSLMSDTTPPLRSAHTAEGHKPKKRRRTGVEILESDLGKKWEPRVDLYGHRPARRDKKSI